jgi:hypothetical protein
MRASVLIAAVAMAAAAGMVRAADETYDVRIERPLKVGQTYGISTMDSVRSSQSAGTSNSPGTRTSNFRRVLMDADVQIDKVDAKGIETAATVTVKKLTLQADTGNVPADQVPPRAVMDPGTVVTLTYDGNKRTFTSKKEGAITDDAVTALDRAFQRMTLTDGAYGPKGKKKVGDTWSLNKDALVVDRTNPNTIDPSLTIGVIKLKAARAIAGVNCLQVDVTMVTSGFPIQGLTPTEASINTNFTLNLPVDTALPVYSWTYKQTKHIVLDQKPAGQATIRTVADAEEAHEATWTPKQ